MGRKTTVFAAVAVGALLVGGVPAAAKTRLQHDLDALGVTGGLARLETRGSVQTARTGPVPSSPYLRAGSVTKTFVSTVMLQLVAEDRISLSDPVSRWLPGVVTGNGNDGTRITIRQLLQQNSGLYNFSLDIYPTLATPEDYRRERWKTASPSELVAIAMRHAPHEPYWEYSNTNYVLAGMVIKAVTGRDWTVEVRDRIIRPLRLHHTSTPGTRPFLPHPHAANHQQWTADGPLEDTTIAVRSLDSGADGSIISTAADLNTFLSALINGKLLAPAERAELHRTVAIPPDALGHTGYGLGLYYQPLPCGGGAWTHGGNGIGYNVEVITTGTRTLTVAEFSRSFVPEVEEPRAAQRRALIENALCS